MSLWVYEEAEKIKTRTKDKEQVVFCTGFGPSGLPHIGTFAEVARISYIRQALQVLAPEKASTIISFADDLDGLRKVPSNVPNQDLLKQNLGKPLTKVPDPFGLFPSFGEHNTAKLCEFLDSFGFEYEFLSATKFYASGIFDNVLLSVLKNHKEITEVVLPTLGEVRQSDYSPFLPICPDTGKVLQAKVLEYDATGITYINENGKAVRTDVTKGKVKLQWKVDWPARWVALGVDYEIYGKDLVDSHRLSSKICRILGGNPPEGFPIEMFLDEEGQKISKSKGNGVTVEDWLQYGTKSSLSYYVFMTPRSTKRLGWRIIPQVIENYLQTLERFHKQTPEQQKQNPVWFVHKGQVPEYPENISFNLLFNLVQLLKTNDQDLLKKFILRYRPQTRFNDFLEELVNSACNLAGKISLDNLNLAAEDQPYIKQLIEDLAQDKEGTADSFQAIFFAIAKTYPKGVKEFFKILYLSLFGSEEGPKLGSFVLLYGKEETLQLLRDLLK